MSAHTPGPWVIGGINGTVYTTDAVFLARTESGEHGDWLHGNPFANGVCEANARLIAAAPELLEALGELVRIAETSLRDDNGNMFSHEQKALTNARAAIAKAEKP